MNDRFSLRKSRAAIVSAVIAPTVMLLALLPAPASAATPKSSDASTLQACTTYIWAYANASFVSANLTSPPDYPLLARASNQGSWENFLLVPHNGQYAIWSYAASRYVTANVSGTGNGALQAKASAIGSWELFTIGIENDTPLSYWIKSSANGKYVTANVSGTGNGALQAKADRVGAWEQFDFATCAFG
ncbi:fascin domain-containing protein [Micromonospora chersina]|uniref:fascin domain-containing protein n=1 Tax=Micromonospora chersina TaxID=47854 RepID=UPI003CB7CFF3